MASIIYFNTGNLLKYQPQLHSILVGLTGTFPLPNSRLTYNTLSLQKDILVIMLRPTHVLENSENLLMSYL